MQFLHPTSVPEPSVICRSTPPYSVVWANEDWTQMTGYTQAEVIGMSSLAGERNTLASAFAHGTDAQYLYQC